MNEQQKRLIRDNPNLGHSAIARLAGISAQKVHKYRKSKGISVCWCHKGCGVPFLSHTIGAGGLVYRLQASHRRVVSCSTMKSAMVNLDRLIYCLENNDGNLPPTRREFYFKDLEFIR